jgi:flagellar protein FliJ
MHASARAMKALPTLLRLARRDLDLLRRALGEEIAKRALLDARIAAHAQTIRDEQAAALRDYDGARAYGGFAAAAAAGKRSLEAEGAGLDAEAARLRALIIEAHVEMRKFERLVELRADQERADAQQREEAERDEMMVMRRRGSRE